MAIQLPFAVIPHDLGTIDGVGNEKSSRPASHAGEFKNPGMVWESSGASNVWVRGNFGAVKDIDFFGLIGTNASASTTMWLRLGDNATEVNGTAPYDSGATLINNPTVVDPDGIYHGHFELPSIVSRQWWRIDVGSHSGDFRNMAIVMGQKRQFADFYNGGGGFEFGNEDMGEIEIGRYGVVSEAEGLMMRTLKMEFGWMSESDRYSKFAPLAKNMGLRNVALWCFDPEPNAYRQSKTYFGWLKELPTFRPTTWKQDRFTSTFEILSMI